jgi:hypothetical protein
MAHIQYSVRQPFIGRALTMSTNACTSVCQRGRETCTRGDRERHWEVQSSLVYRSLKRDFGVCTNIMPVQIYTCVCVCVCVYVCVCVVRAARNVLNPSPSVPKDDLRIVCTRRRVHMCLQLLWWGVLCGEVPPTCSSPAIVHRRVSRHVICTTDITFVACVNHR